MNLIDFIKVVNVFSRERCARIVNKYVTTPWTPHQWANSYGQVVDGVPGPSVNWFSNSMFVEGLKKILYERTEEQYNRKMLNFSPPRLNKYEIGQEMGTHVDHIKTVFNESDSAKKGIPIMSYILLLTDDFDGGNMEFKFQDDSVYIPDLKIGDLLMWPSVFLYPHGITPVTRGERISVVTWRW